MRQIAFLAASGSGSDHLGLISSSDVASGIPQTIFGALLGDIANMNFHGDDPQPVSIEESRINHAGVLNT
jgi:hypothetical protein